jgi:hypothetical protein
MKSPVSLMPLKNWFGANKEMQISYFYQIVHENNPALKLTGQTLFPNWIKTLKNTNGNSDPPHGILNTGGTFYRTFNLDAAQTGDTGEPKFEDGSVLSSFGTGENLRTYTNRTGIAPVNPGWQ